MKLCMFEGSHETRSISHFLYNYIYFIYSYYFISNNYVFSYSIIIESVVDKDNGKSSGVNDEMCTFCEMVVFWMQKELKKNKTEDSIINYADKVKQI